MGVDDGRHALCPQIPAICLLKANVEVQHWIDSDVSEIGRRRQSEAQSLQRSFPFHNVLRQTPHQSHIPTSTQFSCYTLVHRSRVNKQPQSVSTGIRLQWRNLRKHKSTGQSARSKPNSNTSATPPSYLPKPSPSSSLAFQHRLPSAHLSPSARYPPPTKMPARSNHHLPRP